MKKLFAQIVKFGIVGFISFGFDYVTGLIVLNLVMALTSSSYFEMASLVGSVAGFTVSVIANYILSFKFVFERKEDLNKKVEFITFVVLSLIGMLLNSFLIWIVVGPIYRGSTALQQHIGYNLIYTIAKVFATAVRNEKLKEAVMDLLNNRDGLALGICNGFQALIKLGLVPEGKIVEQNAKSPTLTTNRIGRHISYKNCF